MTYMFNLPRSAARTLALSELMYNPEEGITEHFFDNKDVGIDEDEEIVITYVRRKKRPTHPLFDAVTAGVAGYESGITTTGKGLRPE